MVDNKEKYIQRFKEIHYKRTGVWLPDDLACEYFEKLVALTNAITNHLPPQMIIIPKHDDLRKRKPPPDLRKDAPGGK